MNKRDFIKVCSDGKFWRSITRGLLLPYDVVGDKRKLLQAAYQKIHTRNYYPSPPKEYITINKGSGVLRIVPVLQLEDLCVYYYCVRKLEKYIAINHVSKTYGGYGLSGKLRRIEEDEIKHIKDGVEIVEMGGESFVFKELDPYPELSSFSSKAWFAEWGDFSDKLYFNTSQFTDGVVAELDISNFYDSISLDNLEFKIRKYIPHQMNEVVYLLFHFLRFWNRHINFYRQQGVGVPQDMFGECSRILANFYLQDYDKKISDYCHVRGASYFRYADDQVIFAKNKSDLEEIIAIASSVLMREGLNFNQKKVKIMSIQEFNKYYTFKNFISLAGKPSKLNPKVIERQINFYFKNRKSLRKGGASLLKRILVVLGAIQKYPKNYRDFKKYLLSPGFLSASLLGYADFQKMFNLFNQREKLKLIKYLDKSVDFSFCSDYLYNLRRFYKANKLPIRKIGQRIRKVRKMYDFERAYVSS